jgi:hypothetical protein
VWRIGLEEGALQCLLEGGDGASFIGESGLEVGDGLCGGQESWTLRRRIGWRASCEECGADGALCELEVSHDALPSPFAALAMCGTSGGNAFGDGALKESPECAGGQADPTDGVDLPDTQVASAAGSMSAAIITADPVSADGFTASVGIAAVIAVLDERAGAFATGARNDFESFGDRIPFRFALVEGRKCDGASLPRWCPLSSRSGGRGRGGVR